MARLVNEAGVVVVVSDETAARLGSDWKPVEEPKPKSESRSRGK